MSQHPHPDSKPSNGSEIHPDQRLNPATGILTDNPSTRVASQSDQRQNSAADQDGETPHVIHDVLRPVQAAQLEHKVEHKMEHSSDFGSICDSNWALAGGDKSPQTPLQISTPKGAKSARKKRSSKRASNHISCRVQDDEFDILLRRMELTGESQSDAVRAIIRESEEKGGGVQITAKTPPAQLEVMLGALRNWRTAVMATKSRMNIATPASDDGRHAEVVAWRIEIARLLKAIPTLEEVVNIALSIVTSLTPDRVARIKKGIRALNAWKQGFEKDPKQKPFAAFCQDLIDLLEDAGIKLEK